MAKKYVLEAEICERAGKGASRAIRREGKIPAVIYGDNKEPVSVILPGKETTLEYMKGHMFTSLCDVKVGNDTHHVLARDVQLHPVRDDVMHVDFLRVTAKTKITVSVPVNFLNEETSPGLTTEKGILSVARYEVDLVCKATSIPDQIDVDLSEFHLGDSIKISNVNLPEGAVPAIEDRDFTIASIVAPRAAVAATEEAEGEDAEGEETAAEGEEAAEASEDAPAEE